MKKPRITAAAVRAAYAVFEDMEVPSDYYEMSADKQERVRMSIVRHALIAAQTADLKEQA